jgi:hypothetical protein
MSTLTLGRVWRQDGDGRNWLSGTGGSGTTGGSVVPLGGLGDDFRGWSDIAWANGDAEFLSTRSGEPYRCLRWAQRAVERWLAKQAASRRAKP